MICLFFESDKSLSLGFLYGYLLYFLKVKSSLKNSKVKIELSQKNRKLEGFEVKIPPPDRNHSKNRV